ncbi:DUF5946 family protein [Streptomonospora nanhaiensis]|uniref:Uncharacterized protein n=1 Tax=Streptomonospora nanhaiensis TaxID=1323731 RepID=A0A853BPJ0_9ACTN|nr:DUF5946 family protein [Streptomonospora nanhaiensis]MBV2361750.1 hypothetical protein [Streptomonospora nanhaiensis]MBX9391241.1 hypothetical protein [Streptomonospora nanhaiensis]NYI96431.1 hypothetical protein [Streptomonospora nanhaiensis]
MARCPECGAPAGPPSCEELFHAVLALDHARRPPWGPLHGVTVSCYLLQHAGRRPAADRDRAWALLTAYLDRGAEAAVRISERSRRANSHRNRGAALPGLFPGADAPAVAAPPAAFAVTIADVAQDGTFPAEGFADRLTDWARATVTAWREAEPERPRR